MLNKRIFIFQVLIYKTEKLKGLCDSGQLVLFQSVCHKVRAVNVKFQASQHTRYFPETDSVGICTVIYSWKVYQQQRHSKWYARWVERLQSFILYWFLSSSVAEPILNMRLIEMPKCWLFSKILERTSHYYRLKASTITDAVTFSNDCATFVLN